MRTGDVILGAPIDGKQRARLRMLTGTDELALYGCDYPAAIDWIAERLEAGETTIDGNALTRMSIGDVDRLFALLYRGLLGDAVELRQSCHACPESFELTLSLSQLLPEASLADAETRLPGGTRLRAPELGDLLAAGEGEDLVARVTLERGNDSAEDCIAAVERLSPATVENIETSCPHCATEQTIFFDLPRYFLRCTQRERELLLREIHLLARTYRWGLGEILSLKRGERHALVRLATSALAPRDRVQLA